jgi:hypothetical protein
MKRIGLTLIALIILIFAGLFLGQQFQAETSGSLTIVLVSYEEELRRDEVSFAEGDTLYEILSSHYDIYCADANYQPDATCESLFFTEVSGRILLGIDTLSSNWKETFIQIQINGEPAVQGMDQLRFQDQDEIRLVLKNAE